MGKFGNMLMDQAGQALGNLQATGMGLLTAKWNDKRQLKQQRKLMEMDEEYAQRMGRFNFDQQLAMWKATGYDAQKSQMKEAGLNPALMYGMGGGGGMTVGSASATAGKSSGAPVGGGEVMGMMQMRAQQELLRAQKENIQADTELKKVDAAKTSGVDTELAGTQIQSLTQGIQESKAKTRLTDVTTELSEIDRNFKSETYKASVMGLKYNTDIALQELNILRNDAVISETTWSTKVDMITAEAAGILLRNKLTSSQIENTETSTSKIKQDIAAVIQSMQAQLKELSQKDRALSQEDENILINKARNELIELGIWVGAGSQVLGDAVNILKKPTQVNNVKNYKKDIIIKDGSKGPY